MKRYSILCIILVLVLLLLSPISVQADDITGHYFENDIRALIHEGIMVGYDDGIYKPNREVTRAEFTVFLVRILGLTDSSQSTSFTDVSQQDWFYKDISIANSHQLINGYPNGSFQPNKKITRQEIAAITHRALQSKGIRVEEASLNFVDKETINPIYHKAIAQLLALNIIVGKIDENGNRYYHPLKQTTRGETAAILNRIRNVLKGPTEIITYTKYNYDFLNMVAIQMTKTPKVDGSGIYLASQELVSYYTNPSNFATSSSDFLQFLTLSQSSGLSVEELNNKVLKGKGSLEGQGQAFIDASTQYNVNEVYLIAHALHETGNGTSALASGYLVSQVDGKSVPPKKTYNMYGIKAYDSNALKMGSEHAYKEGWFTPRDAIIGGAKFLAEGYINRGQDTLYKMRWNPSSPGYPQYATHVAWAVLQTHRMREIYSLLDFYVLHFDVPVFLNQPGSMSYPSGASQYFVNRKREGMIGTTTVNLNIRTGPTTSFPIIKTLPQNTRVTIIGENGGWFKVTSESITGWVSGEYLNL
ncbi:S-layer homology domain-containing protein [Ornithinibacillus xuwenensis]|uniref:S-layer homology domain-containing protein n=1 Tax=Ornithinibacillus xuwenensis TaxID=3144668 RepID=A0ABU9XGE7_9BACI